MPKLRKPSPAMVIAIRKPCTNLIQNSVPGSKWLIFYEAL